MRNGFFIFYAELGFTRSLSAPFPLRPNLTRFNTAREKRQGTAALQKLRHALAFWSVALLCGFSTSGNQCPTHLIAPEATAAWPSPCYVQLLCRCTRAPLAVCVLNLPGSPGLTCGKP